MSLISVQFNSAVYDSDKISWKYEELKTFETVIKILSELIIKLYTRFRDENFMITVREDSAIIFSDRITIKKKVGRLTTNYSICINSEKYELDELLRTICYD